ncbi:MAG: hypothetical protein LBH84_04580 [Prevotellaceae bacterium]|jgi:hypothetical protein|nr:hypothetical protein [Prevotellaceae bacterium]
MKKIAGGDPKGLADFPATAQLLQVGRLLMLLALLAVGNLPAEAQLGIGDEGVSNPHPDAKMPEFFSDFRDFRNEDFSGTFSGVLFLQKIGSKGAAKFTFRHEKASLHVVFDSSYNASCKHYLLKRSDIQLRYTICRHAKRFEVMVGTDTVSVSTAGGANDGAINGLEWTYLADKNTERLYLYALTDISLRKNQTGANSYANRYTVRKGSGLCFDISRKKTKEK